MKLCKSATKTATVTTVVIILRQCIELPTVAITKLMISGKKNMIPMVLICLIGISINLVRADPQLLQQRQQQQQHSRQYQQQRSTTKNVDSSAYYYECVKIKSISPCKFY